MHPKHLSILDFSYPLSEERIAKFPLSLRDTSKLLVYNNEEISQDYYYNLHNHIPENSLIIFNNTKVVEARLLFEKTTGSVIEIFCLEPGESYGDITVAMMQKSKVYWKCLVGGAKKWKEDFLLKELNENGVTIQLQAKIIEKKNDYFLIEFCWNNNELCFSELLHLFGVIPLPPYIKRSTTEQDRVTYQTIYAKFDGSVAAPTAGLHFTDVMVKNLKAKNIQPIYTTLHVGAGTFKPVKALTMQEHEMHAEYIEVTRQFIEQLLSKDFPTIIAVGTTSLRTIESLYWMGVKIKTQTNFTSFNEIAINQWDAYELPQEILVNDALNSLLQWMIENNKEKIITKTQIIIAPGYNLKVADALVTNFHQPQSTLLLLVAAIAGNNWKKIYHFALENDFRFLSYGDGSLIWKNKKTTD